MLSEIKEGVEREVEAAKSSERLYRENKDEIKRVAHLLLEDEITIQRASLSGNCVDLSITGDFAIMKAVFRTFRKAGYEPTTRPTEEKTSSFSCYFKKADQEMKFWFSFSSTICKRIKIGSEMREVPIYETVCE